MYKVAVAGQLYIGWSSDFHKKAYVAVDRFGDRNLIACEVHRIVEQPRLEGTSKNHLVQPFVGRETR